MRDAHLTNRLRMLLELALTSEDVDADRRRLQEQRASAQGLSGIEIDAARRGRSFDVRLNQLLGVIMNLWHRHPANRPVADGKAAYLAGQSEDPGLLAQLTEEVLQAVVRDDR